MLIQGSNVPLTISAGSANRVMSIVTLEQADGRTILRESIGNFPDMTLPEPEGDAE